MSRRRERQTQGSHYHQQNVNAWSTFGTSKRWFPGPVSDSPKHCGASTYCALSAGLDGAPPRSSPATSAPMSAKIRSSIPCTTCRSSNAKSARLTRPPRSVAGDGIVVAPVAHQRERADPSRALVAGIVGCRRQGQKRRPIPGHPGDDRFLVTSQFGGLAFPAACLEMGIQGREVLKAGDGYQKVPPGIAEQALDLAFIITLAGPPKSIGEEIVGLQLAEDPSALASARRYRIPKHLGYRLTVKTKNSGRLANRQPLDVARTPNTTIQID